MARLSGRGLNAAERKRALATARQARWRKEQKRKALIAAGLPEGTEVANVDLASIIAAKIANRLTDDELDFLDRDTQGLVRLGIASESLRLKAEAKKAEPTAELAWAILRMLAGEGAAAAALDDGRTIEGTARDVTDDE